MPTLPSSLPATNNTPSTLVQRGLGGWRLAAAGGLVLAAGLLGWGGGAVGMASAMATALALPWLLRQRGNPADAVPLDPLLAEPRVSGGRVGAEVMVAQVVPVWGKQLEITRDAAADGLGKLLDGFSQIAQALGTMADNAEAGQAGAHAGALDSALAEGAPAHQALQALLAPSQRAFNQRDAAVAQLVNCSNALADLRQLGRQARELGKHTRLVAFNASIEANRGGNGSDAGSQAVANETRMLAGRMAEVGEQVERLVARLDSTLAAERLRAEVGDTSPEELQLELAVQARAALVALLAGLGGALGGSGAMKDAASLLNQQIEQSFVNFQFGDRLSQMLAIVATDMHNFARWISANPYATQTDAAEWLANLEASYTMEEQRSQHHGNVHIDRGSEIEFF